MERGRQLPYGVEDFWGRLRLGLRGVLALGKGKDNFDKDNLLGVCGLDDLAGLMDLADEASASENRKICGMTTRPIGRCPMGGRAGNAPKS